MITLNNSNLPMINRDELAELLFEIRDQKLERCIIYDLQENKLLSLSDFELKSKTIYLDYILIEKVDFNDLESKSLLLKFKINRETQLSLIYYVENYTVHKNIDFEFIINNCEKIFGFKYYETNNQFIYQSKVSKSADLDTVLNDPFFVNRIFSETQNKDQASFIETDTEIHKKIDDIIISNSANISLFTEYLINENYESLGLLLDLSKISLKNLTAKQIFRVSDHYTLRLNDDSYKEFMSEYFSEEEIIQELMFSKDIKNDFILNCILDHPNRENILDSVLNSEIDVYFMIEILDLLDTNRIKNKDELMSISIERLNSQFDIKKLFSTSNTKN